MEKRHDDHAVLTHPVQEAIPVDEQLPKRHVPDLRHNPPSVGQGGETAGNIKGTRQHPSGAIGRVLENVIEYRIEREAARLGPNYLAWPSNHLRRSSNATCSW